MGAAVPPCTRCCREDATADAWEGVQARPWEAVIAPGEPDKLLQTPSMAPLLIHFDVNKTILLSDSLIAKSIEDGVRESISELFWGRAAKRENETVWEWDGTRPSVVSASAAEEDASPKGELMTYYQFCKDYVKDKDERKKAIRAFNLVGSKNSQIEMENWVKHALKKMELPPNVGTSTQAKAAGLKGTTYVMLPALFYLVASLHTQRRQFAIVFRSFGDDHEKIKIEWNAFCELRHPVFSKLIEDIGPMDGSVPGVPDRRIHAIHTLYRDAQGPMLILDTFTNGPKESPWDAWAKKKPKPQADTRDGRTFIKELGATTVDGIEEMQRWMLDQLANQATAAVKDDWAWWQFHGEDREAGKLLLLIGGNQNSRQIFFDDNVEHDDPRIVDCRYPDDTSVPVSKALGKLCVKVNPVEALLDETYFIRKLIMAETAGVENTGLTELNFYSKVAGGCCLGCGNQGVAAIKADRKAEIQPVVADKSADKGVVPV